MLIFQGVITIVSKEGILNLHLHNEASILEEKRAPSYFISLHLNLATLYIQLDGCFQK